MRRDAIRGIRLSVFPFPRAARALPSTHHLSHQTDDLTNAEKRAVPGHVGNVCQTLGTRETLTDMCNPVSIKREYGVVWHAPPAGHCGLSGAPDAPAPRGASGSAGVVRREATGSSARCQASMPPVRTETIGKWCSRSSCAALTERPSVCHTVTMDRPQWGTRSRSRPASAGKGSKTAPSMGPNAPAHSSGLRIARTTGEASGTAACGASAASAALGGASGG